MLDVPALIAAALDVALGDLAPDAKLEAAVEPSARSEFGDWSSPVALRAAKVLRRPPMVIAEEIRQLLLASPMPIVREWTVTPPGYLNARLRESEWAPGVISAAESLDRSVPIILTPELPTRSGKTLVEHTATNPNKAAHVGHLRNACIGDAVSRILRRTGHPVEVNNYIDDTGVQVADVTVGIRELGLAPEPDEPFDQFCSRAYVDVCRRYDHQPDLVERRRATLHAIEAGDNEVAVFVKDLASRIVDAHLATMGRFGIGYDLLTWESDIIALGFWRSAFERLRDSGTVVFTSEGRTAGCWVLPDTDAPDGTAEESDDDAKVLVKSDGVATYTAKDIAYQLWKFGLLGRDFHYRHWRDDPAQPVTTRSTSSGGDLEPIYGHAWRVVNVIDQRQAYPQQVVRRALGRLGHVEQADNSIHLAYEVVALSPSAARDLGVDVDAGRNLYALSGRRGIEVRADELLDRAIERVMAKGSAPDTARIVAAGAIRYYLQKFSLMQVIAFDFDEALRTTGDTGVYLQYAHARAASILRKVPDDGETLVVPTELHPRERVLLHRIEAYPRAVIEAAATLAPTSLCAYAFSLATALSEFYEHTPAIVRETDALMRRFRRRLVAATRATLADVLLTLGITPLDQM